MTTVEVKSGISKEDFFKLMNDKRLASKGWYWDNLIVEGKHIAIKGYKTWLQIYTVDGIDWSNMMDQKVSTWKSDLRAPFKDKHWSN